MKTEPNARIHLVAMVVVLLTAVVVGVTPTEWCLLAFAIGGVLSSELLNTAVEDVVDLTSPEHHPLAGRAKDLAAAAVLVASLVAVAVGLIVFVPKFFDV